MGINQRSVVAMTEDEVRVFIESSRTATLATVGPGGFPHLTAMWFALVDGVVCFETKGKSQKVVNLRRDSRVSYMVEAGDTYDQLRGVEVEGTAEIIEDVEEPTYWAAGASLYERYTGPVTDETWPNVRQLMRNRVVVRIVPNRVRSWDHRKLGMPAMDIAGSTVPQ